MAKYSFVTARRNAFYPVAAGGIPGDFTGPRAGDTILTDSAYWNLLMGSLTSFNNAAYASQPVLYFDRTAGQREIEIGYSNGVEIYLGDTGLLRLTWEFRGMQSDDVLFSQVVTVNSGQFGGVNTLAATLQPPLPSGVYRLRGVCAAGDYGLFDKFVLI